MPPCEHRRYLSFEDRDSQGSELTEAVPTWTTKLQETDTPFWKEAVSSTWAVASSSVVVGVVCVVLALWTGAPGMVHLGSCPVITLM